MTFSYGELEKLFFKIQDIIEYFEQSDFERRRTVMFLSNGDKLNYRVPKESIPHLLGINTDHLIATRRFKSTNSFELLKELVENAYSIHQLSSQGIIYYNILFSPYILSKVESMLNNIKINVFETEFICKYQTQNAYTYTENIQKYNYFIIKKYENTGKYGMLCLVKKNDSKYDYYVPMSNQSFDMIVKKN